MGSQKSPLWDLDVFRLEPLITESVPNVVYDLNTQNKPTFIYILDVDHTLMHTMIFIYIKIDDYERYVPIHKTKSFCFNSLWENAVANSNI